MHPGHIRVSAALRRIGNLRPRNPREWREAKTIENERFYAEQSVKTRRPVLVKRSARAEGLETLSLADVLRNVPAPVSDVVSVTLPQRSQIGEVR